MRLGWSKKENSTSYYVQQTIYVNGKNKSQVIKRLGSEKYICETYGVSDAKAWALEQVDLMRQEEADENSPVTIPLSPAKDLINDQRRCFNGGYLFLQDIYYQLGLDRIGKGYVPTYTKNELTDDLHNAFGFNTSKEIIPNKKMRNVHERNFKKPRSPHKYWGCEASTSFLVSKTGLYYFPNYISYDFIHFYF